VLPVSILPQGIQANIQINIQVESQWHGDLDKYGSFCITVPLDQINKIAEKLAASNYEWSNRAESDPNAPRNLDV